MCTDSSSFSSTKRRNDINSNMEREYKLQREVQQYANHLRASNEDFFFNRVECNSALYNSISAQFFILTREQDIESDKSTNTSFDYKDEPNSDPLPMPWSKFDMFQIELNDTCNR